jgi:hypothetical protein
MSVAVVSTIDVDAREGVRGAVTVAAEMRSLATRLEDYERC